MTAQSDPYVRVYYRIIGDDRFTTVFDDDARLACWLRLLLVADATYPVPAPIPAGTRRAALAHLVSVGLVELTAGSRFRIHGMESERSRQSARGKAGADARWNAPPDANAMRTHSERNASADASPMHSAPLPPLRSASLRSAPTAGTPDAMQPDDAYGVMLLVEELTGLAFSYREGSRVHDTLTGDVGNHGAERIAAEYRAWKAAANGEPVDAAQIVFGVHNKLHPLSGTVKATATEVALDPASEAYMRMAPADRRAADLASGARQAEKADKADQAEMARLVAEGKA